MINKQNEKTLNKILRNLIILFVIINALIMLLLLDIKNTDLSDIHLRYTGFSLLSITCYYYISSSLLEKNIQKLRLVWLYLAVYFVITISQVTTETFFQKLFIIFLLIFYTFSAIIIFNSTKELYDNFNRFFINKYGISNEFKSKLFYN